MEDIKDVVGVGDGRILAFSRPDSSLNFKLTLFERNKLVQVALMCATSVSHSVDVSPLVRSYSLNFVQRNPLHDPALIQTEYRRLMVWNPVSTNPQTQLESCSARSLGSPTDYWSPFARIEMNAVLVGVCPLSSYRKKSSQFTWR